MKYYHKQYDQGLSPDEIATVLSEQRGVSSEKIALLVKVGAIQRPVLEKGMQPRHVSLYGGIPFCTSHCSYCSFPFGLIHQYSHMEAFIKAYIQDCENLAQLIKQYALTVDTLYMGGGTPTSLSEEHFDYVLQAFAHCKGTAQEFTVEAGRPDTVTDRKLQAMVEAGVTRISINPQTMQDQILQSIGRQHSAASITAVYERVRQHTDFQVNMDFIAGLPGQSLTDMRENMDYVCQKRPENVTIHTLALKKGSPLYESKAKENLPEAEVVKEMVAYSAARLEEAGYEPYYLYRQQYMRGSLENVGYALPGSVCAYNIHMMEERQPIIAVGPGTTSKWMRGPEYRQRKQYLPKDVDTYIKEQPQLLAKRQALCEQFYGEE